METSPVGGSAPGNGGPGGSGSTFGTHPRTTGSAVPSAWMSGVSTHEPGAPAYERLRIRTSLATSKVPVAETRVYSADSGRLAAVDPGGTTVATGTGACVARSSMRSACSERSR